MILETYLNENKDFRIKEMEYELLHENISQSIYKVWDTIKRKFREFINWIISKWKKIKNIFKKSKKTEADELVNKLKDADKNISEAVLKSAKRICIIRDYHMVLLNNHIDMDNIVRYVLKTENINIPDDSDFIRSNIQAKSFDFDNVSTTNLINELVSVLQQSVINKAFVYLDVEGENITTEIDYDNLYSFVNVTDTDEVYRLSDMVNSSIEKYERMYDNVYDDTLKMSKEIYDMKLPQNSAIPLVKYFKLKLFLISKIVNVLDEINQKLFIFRKNNNLKIMNSENDIKILYDYNNDYKKRMEIM